MGRGLLEQATIAFHNTVSVMSQSEAVSFVDEQQKKMEDKTITKERT
jgi:hypothetical protein